MTETRDYLARSLSDRIHRSGGLSTYMETGAPALQQDLDSLHTGVVREQNEQQNTVLKTAVVESEDRIMVAIGTVRVEISTQIQGIEQQLTASTVSAESPHLCHVIC